MVAVAVLLGPDENLLEVWVVSCELSPGVLAMGASSFMLVDFFDYESQVHTQPTHSLTHHHGPQWLAGC